MHPHLRKSCSEYKMFDRGPSLDWLYITLLLINGSKSSGALTQVLFEVLVSELIIKNILELYQISFASLKNKNELLFNHDSQVNGHYLMAAIDWPFSVTNSLDYVLLPIRPHLWHEHRTHSKSFGQLKGIASICVFLQIQEYKRKKTGIQIVFTFFFIYKMGEGACACSSSSDSLPEAWEFQCILANVPGICWRQVIPPNAPTTTGTTLDCTFYICSSCCFIPLYTDVFQCSFFLMVFSAGHIYKNSTLNLF